jgi:hypothetical protein
MSDIDGAIALAVLHICCGEEHKSQRAWRVGNRDGIESVEGGLGLGGAGLVPLSTPHGAQMRGVAGFRGWRQRRHVQRVRQK